MACAQISPTPGVTATLVCPAEARSSEPRPVDLSSLPGAELVASEAWRWAGAELQLSCVRMPTTLWVDGLERPLLDGASALVKKTAGLSSLAGGAVSKDGPRVVQSFEGDAHGQPAHGKHIFGFIDGGALLCSSVCVGDGCDVDVSVSGSFRNDAEASWLMAGIEQASEHPRVAVGSGAALLLATVALLLARRPRPRW